MNNKQNGVSRLLRLVWKEYKIEMLVVILAIIGSALASVKGTLFLQTLIDDYIVPLTESNYPDFAPLASALFKIAMIYILGILCSYIYNRIMVNVSQGTMKIIRIKLFNHMQSLPIQYFDSHSHGDIMSIYTNDTDTLRQFLSQSVPQLFNSIITIVSIFVAMITLNIPLTIITLVMVAIMLVVAKNAAALSSKYFNQQQNNLGKLNGFIEEMISGQKVVKVFCYEKRSLARFRSVNEELKESSQKANIYGNILMPIIIQIGNVSYVICAVIGSILILNGYGGLSVGMLVSFLTLNKNFNQPFGQVSQQLNSIIMATAGINRIYALLDEESESDNGYISLVNVECDSTGNFIESTKRTGKWAWKHYHKADDTTTYQELNGEILFENVDFGYSDEKLVLHDINLFAKKGQKIAFVGSTGAGKTTITNLINRFYDIQDGKIRYDNININRRIVSMTEETVTYLVKDYKNGGKYIEQSIKGTEFLRMFLMHVLPKGFVRIRHYGLLSCRNKKEKMAHCRKLLNCIQYISKLRGKTCAEKLMILYKKDICKCEACGGNLLSLLLRGHYMLT